jgi:hypothetical protein
MRIYVGRRYDKGANEERQLRNRLKLKESSYVQVRP